MKPKSRYHLVIVLCILSLALPVMAGAANLNYVTITKPLKTDAWYAGGVYDVEWTCTYVDGTTNKNCPVTVSLNRGGKQYAVQSGANGRLAYSVPYDIFKNFPDVTGNAVAFQLGLTSGNLSSSTTRIVNRANITFISPKQDSSITPGSTLRMAWTYNGNLPPFKLVLAGSAGSQDLAQNVSPAAGGGNYSVDLPIIIPGQPEHEIQARAADGTVISRSATFKILYPVPTVIVYDKNGKQLASNGAWTAGTTGTIGFAILRHATVNVDLVDASNLNSVYERIRPNYFMNNQSEKITYTPPANKPKDFYTRTYRIKVTPVNNGLQSRFGRSEPFKITQTSGPEINATTDKCPAPISMSGKRFDGKPRCYAHTSDANWNLEAKSSLKCDENGYFCCYPEYGTNNTRCGANQGLLMNLECYSGAVLIQPYGCYR